MFKIFKFLTLSLLIMISLFSSGCATFNKAFGVTPEASICALPESQGSIICALAEKRNTTPEAISKSLLWANFAALETGVIGEDVPIDKALKYIDVIIDEVTYYRAELNKSGMKINLDMVSNYVQDRYDALPPRVQNAFIVLRPQGLSGLYFESPLVDKDFEMILYQLNEMRKMIAAYQ